MPDRSIVVRLRADISDYKAKMSDASRSTLGVGKSSEQAERQTTGALGRASASLSKHRDEWNAAGTAAIGFGAAGVAALGLTAKAAIDWESAWAGVRKTVDGTDAEMAELEKGLRNLAKTLPSTHSEIAAVAEAAGQLGVARKDILGFTKTMIDLGETTNLTADEAATSIAQISNVMGTMQREGAKGVERLGSTLVELGNNGASTERDIVQMASRIAGAAKVVGMSEADLLAVSNALASVGIEAEAGGTAVSKVLIDMSKAVKQGGEDLDGFARVAGLSAAEFAAAFNESPAEAMNLFTTGLGRIKDAGGDVFTTLDGLGQSEVRTSRALLTMAGAGDLLTKSLQDGRTAWEENNALAEEAAKRYATTASKLEVARNSITDAAVSIGSVFLPAIAGAAEKTAGFAGWIAGLPEPVKATGATLGLAASAALLFGGATVKAALSVMELHAALQATALAGGRLTGALKAAGAAGVALTGLAVAGAGMSKVWLAMSGANDDATRSLEAYIEGGRKAQHVTDIMSIGFRDVADTIDTALSSNLGDYIGGFLDEVGRAGGLLGTTVRDDVAAFFDQLDDGLTGLVQGGKADKAAEQVKRFTDEAERQGYTAQQITDLLPQYSAALALAGAEQEAGAGAASDYTDALDDMGETAADATVSLQDLASKIQGFGSAAMGADAAEAAFRQSVDDATAAVKENGKTVDKTRTSLDLHTEAGRANQRALQDLATDTKNNAAATLELGGSYDDAAARVDEGRAAFIRSATQMGLTKAAAEDLADKYGLIPEDVSTLIEVGGDKLAMEKVDDFIARIQSIPRSKESTIAARVSGIGTLEYMVSLVRQMTNKTIRYTVAGRGGGGQTINADGNIVSFADGGSFRGAQPQVRKAGGAGVLWAEEGAGPWEAFVSGHPAKKTRSRSITSEVAARLGGMVVWAKPYADGGIRSTPVSRSAAPVFDYSRLAAAVGPSQHSESYDQPIYIAQLVSSDVADFRRKAERERAYASTRGLGG